jgi:hypothetical protein
MREVDSDSMQASRNREFSTEGTETRSTQRKQTQGKFKQGGGGETDRVQRENGYISQPIPIATAKKARKAHTA